MFTAKFVLIVFLSNGNITFAPGFETFQSCVTAQEVTRNVAELVYAQPVVLAAYCVSQTGSGEES